jgi:ATP-binding cassette subfamily B protein/subfamily B ATP-binding cassette protein MsbA
MSASRFSTDSPFAARSRTSWEIVRRVAHYLKPYKLFAIGTIGCAILSLAASFAFPLLTRHIINDVIGGKRAELLLPAILGVIGAFLARDLFNTIRIQLNNHFEQHVIFDMRREIYGRLQRLPAGYFDNHASGDLMTRVLEDVNAVERLLIDGTEQGTVAILGILGVTGILLWQNPVLAGVAMIPIPFLIIGALWYSLTAHRRYRVQREASSAMNALLMDNLQGVRAIKSFGREAHEDGRFADKAEGLRQGTLVVMKAWSFYSPAMAFCTAAGSALVLWIGGRQVIEGTMQVGDLVGFLFFLALFYEPIGRLHGLNQMLQSARAAGERVFDILDAPVEREPIPQPNAEPEHPLTRPAATLSPSDGERDGVRGFPDHTTMPGHNPARPWRAKGEVVFDHVHFHYAEGQPVLKDINLHAKPGEMIALVGPTGAGKTTLAALLPAFYEATDGAIQVDGRDIRSLSLEELRSQISVVSQEPFLFNGTIRENILYGRLDASEADMVAAAQAANCHDFISRLPDGYDSKVGERGVKLSGGEKQRVAIARALLKDAPILVLDEATASVDTQTEKLIQEALEHLMAGRTSFVIAHRLSTIQHADQILVLKHGQIVERGNHETLLAQGGVYATLCRIQSARMEAETLEQAYQA